MAWVSDSMHLNHSIILIHTYLTGKIERYINSGLKKQVMYEGNTTRYTLVGGIITITG